MARHLRKAGFEVTGYDVDDAARRAGRSGITLAADPGAVAQRSDFVIVVVGFDKEVETGAGGRGASPPPRALG
jgi:3-hydroxyisobutyrate dehydrogenase-like beta-hydroxyacid dehydrogenase